MPQESASPLLSPDLHEIGTRLVDLLNQTGFLYRFPEFAGVTLACMAQHFTPARKLLESCEPDRKQIGHKESPEGYSIGKIERSDPLAAAYDYALEGYRTFVNHLKRVAAESTDASGQECNALSQVGDESDPQRILECKTLIETYSERAAADAQKEFHPIDEQDWQGFRMILFFFLLELEKARKPQP